MRSAIAVFNDLTFAVADQIRNFLYATINSSQLAHASLSRQASPETKQSHCTAHRARSFRHNWLEYSLQPNHYKQKRLLELSKHTSSWVNIFIIMLADKPTENIQEQNMITGSRTSIKFTRFWGFRWLVWHINVKFGTVAGMSHP